MYSTNVIQKATISSTKEIKDYIRIPEELLKVDGKIIITALKLIKNT